MATYSDADIIAAIQAESRASYGRENCGIRARDVGFRLYDATRPESAMYDPDPTIAAVRRKIGQMARRGVLSRGKDRDGLFYRATPRLRG
jgi:hypothetical protein